MKKILLSVATTLVLASCGGGGDTADKSGMSEQDIIAGFKGAEAKFKNVFENPGKFDQAQLKPLNDSLAFFVDALIADFPKSAELPEVLIEGGIRSLNVKNGKKAIQYLNYMVDSFPEHKDVPRAMFFVGRTKEVVLEDVEGAKEAYKKLYRAYPNSAWGQNARTSVELIVKPALLEQTVTEEQEQDSTEVK